MKDPDPSQWYDTTAMLGWVLESGTTYSLFAHVEDEMTGYELYIKGLMSRDAVTTENTALATFIHSDGNNGESDDDPEKFIYAASKKDSSTIELSLLHVRSKVDEMRLENTY